MTKRSKRVAIAIIGATAFTLAGCRDEKIDAAAFPDVQSCKNEASFGGTFTGADCETAFAEAETLHVESAPRYNSVEVCEEQHGVGACGSEAQQTQGGSGGRRRMASSPTRRAPAPTPATKARQSSALRSSPAPRQPQAKRP